MHISLYIRIISSHINTSFPISYFIFSVFKRVFAILQLKASKLIVYFVSFTVVIFTILNIFPTREYYLMENANNTTTSNNTSYKSHLMHTYGRRTADFFHQCSKLIGKSSKSSYHISFLKCCRDFGLVPKGLRLKTLSVLIDPKPLLRRRNRCSLRLSSMDTRNHFPVILRSNRSLRISKH